MDDDIPAEVEPASRDRREGRAHPAHARERARRLLSDHRVTRPPVPVHAIARKEGLRVRESGSLKKLRARLVGTVIEVNAGDPKVAQRFSVAHELGHHLLGSAHGDGEAAEREADAFAGELLVPGYMLESVLRRETEAVRLARQFNVSRTTLEIAAQHHRLADRLD